MEKNKKIGRPPLEPKQLRDRLLQIRLNADEEKELLAAASRNVSTWAREALLRLARRQRH